MVRGPAMRTWPRVTSKKRATSATYSRPLFLSQGSLPLNDPLADGANGTNVLHGILRQQCFTLR